MVCLIRIPSLSLETLFKEIYLRESASTTHEMNQLIMKWRRKFILIRDLVVELNGFIGQTMFLFIFLGFTSSINLIFNAIAKVLTNNRLYLVDNILEAVVNVIFFGLLAFVSDQIPRQVSEINVIVD